MDVDFPSELDSLEPDEVYRSIACVLDSAYPSQRLTPTAHLLHMDGKTQEFDLSNHFEGSLHRKSLENPNLRAAIYQVESTQALLATAIPIGSEEPMFMHGFVKIGGGSIQEFVKMTHKKASEYLDKDFAQELLIRNRSYSGQGEAIAYDAADLVDKIKYICDQRPQRDIFGKN